MYIPPSFLETDPTKLHDFMEQHSFATLISSHEGEPVASHLPLLLDRETGPHGRLIGHMARANSHWQTPANQRVLAIYHGPHAYVSPGWIAAQNFVPTWNYVTVHAYGTLRLIEDRDHLRALLQRTVTLYESNREQPWSMASPDLEIIEKLLAAIVGFEIDVNRLEELRATAALAEKQSIERTNVLRERLKQSEGIGDAEVKKALRAELRIVVLEAFKARHDLHAAEVAALEKQAQAMKQKLVEREASAAEIVDRRVEDLLNPDKQWIAESPTANVPFRETTAIEPPTGNENKLLVRRSETSVTVEGRFDGNEEILMVIVTVGHVELPNALNVVPINIVIRRRAGTEQPVAPRPQNKLPDDKADDAQSEARSGNGQTKIAIGKILYSLPFSFPSVDSILSQMTEGNARSKHERIVCELVKYQVSDARRYPLVGLAQLV